MHVPRLGGSLVAHAGCMTLPQRSPCCLHIRMMYVHEVLPVCLHRGGRAHEHVPTPLAPRLSGAVGSPATLHLACGRAWAAGLHQLQLVLCGAARMGAVAAHPGRPGAHLAQRVVSVPAGASTSCRPPPPLAWPGGGDARASTHSLLVACPRCFLSLRLRRLHAYAYRARPLQAPFMLPCLPLPHPPPPTPTPTRPPPQFPVPCLHAQVRAAAVRAHHAAR